MNERKHKKMGTAVCHKWESLSPEIIEALLDIIQDFFYPSEEIASKDAAHFKNTLKVAVK